MNDLINYITHYCISHASQLATTAFKTCAFNRFKVLNVCSNMAGTRLCIKPLKNNIILILIDFNPNPMIVYNYRSMVEKLL